MKFYSLLLLVCCGIFAPKANANDYHVYSPNKTIDVIVSMGESTISYQVKKSNSLLLESSKLGLIREDENFAENLSLFRVDPTTVVKDKYELLNIKRRFNTYLANKKIFHLKNRNGKLIDIIFQVSNDGFVFRYFFPEKSTDIKKIKNEITTFNFASDAKAWLQPMANVHSEWSKTGPSYELHYKKDISVDTPSPIEAGWVFPALYHAKNQWIVISETFNNSKYCGTRLEKESPNGEYKIGFPQDGEIFTNNNGALYPESKTPWYSPWRVVTIGSLKTIGESTLGTDVAAPCVITDHSYIKPGVASWSWALLKDSATIYPVQKQFIDYASEMKWRYCTVDAVWDKQIGYEKLTELSQYAQSKNVGLFVWYNSAGSWNDVYFSPKDRLVTHEARVEEFSRLKSMGVKGVKIDFFNGDGQSMIDYYIDILKDANDFQLLVNFHGATLPRGLQRTYPNLITAEAVKGMEHATFNQSDLKELPSHCTMLPFTRNIFDPMDFTPMALYKVPGLKRETTSPFELALTVLLQSGVQHLVETPDDVTHAPEFVKDYLKKLPNAWSDTKLISAYPGKFLIMARKVGKSWFVAGINGENVAKTFDFDLSFLQNYQPATSIEDGDVSDLNSFTQGKIIPSKNTKVKVNSNGGFVAIFDTLK